MRENAVKEQDLEDKKRPDRHSDEYRDDSQKNAPFAIIQEVRR